MVAKELHGHVKKYANYLNLESINLYNQAAFYLGTYIPNLRINNKQININ